MNGAQRINALVEADSGRGFEIKRVKRYWKWAALAGAVLAAIYLIYTVTKVTTFVNESTGGNRTNTYVTATIVPTASAAPGTQVAALNSTPLPTSVPLSSAPILQRIKRGERVSMVVMGYGGVGHQGTYLTDTILVMDYDPATNTVSMFNIPRDMLVFVAYGPNSTGAWDKVNTAFQNVMSDEGLDVGQLAPQYRYTDQTTRLDSAANLVADTVEKVVGFRIDYWVAVNFDGFRNLINALGGLDINVPAALTDNEYPANDNPDIDASTVVLHFDAGVQHMDGERAIRYARSRHADNDFGRSKRQMQVIQAVKERLNVSTVALNLWSIVDALKGNIRTSLTSDELHALYDYFNDKNNPQTKNTLGFASNIISPDNLLSGYHNDEWGDYFLPEAGKSDYSQIHTWVARVIAAADIRRENATIQVLNSSTIKGVAGQLTDQMVLRGFRMAAPEQDAEDYDTTIIYDYSAGKAATNVALLKKMMPNATVRVTTQRPYDGCPEIIIHLGADYAASISRGALTTRP